MYNNKQISKQCKIITSLAFLFIEELANKIVNMYLIFTQHSLPFISYFYSTYISRNNATSRLPFQIWNVRHQMINNSHKLINFNEG